jgi:hypothetical protein
MKKAGEYCLYWAVTALLVRPVVPGAAIPHNALQWAIHAPSATNPCRRETHFWISWSGTRRWVAGPLEDRVAICH